LLDHRGAVFAAPPTISTENSQLFLGSVQLLEESSLLAAGNGQILPIQQRLVEQFRRFAL
jgi:hypothetical protein